MRFISLFSGVGGADYGLEQAGLTCVAQVEIDPFCRAVLSKHWPNVPKLRDVRDVKGSDLPPANLIWGSPPCQPHSVAGQRGGAKDDRNLWPEYLRIIKEFRPTWVVFENVPGIITTMLDEVLVDLESEAYTAIPLNLPAVGFDADHNRYRIFVVGYTEHNGSHGSKISQRSSQRDESKTRTNKTGKLERSDSKPKSLGRDGDSRRWLPEPRLDRMVGRDASRMDARIRVERMKAIGNIVVPQIAEFIGYYIMRTDDAL